LLSFWYFYFRHIGVDVYNYSPHYASRIKHNHVFTSLNPQVPTIVYSFWPEWEALAYASSYGLCLLAVLYGSAKLKRPFEFSVLGWVASISFSLYMWHLPLLTFAKAILVHLHQRSWNPIVQYSYFWAWILIIIIPVSVILHRCIEQPGMHLSQWLVYKLERSKEKSNVATQPS
jgi:peptidoglycan/LPS O-acetylase OafA/YrhL